LYGKREEKAVPLNELELRLCVWTFATKVKVFNLQLSMETKQEPHERIKRPESVIPSAPEKPQEGPLNELAIAEKEADKIALYKEAGKETPIESQVGLSPEQYDELQSEIQERKH